MRKNLIRIVSAILAMAALLSTGAMAAGADSTGTTVRVSDTAVPFPDTPDGNSSALTPEQITRLQAYGHTAPDNAVTYEMGKARYNDADLRFYYGDRSGFDVFDNAREHLYHTMDCSGTYHCKALGKTLSGLSCEEFYRQVVAEAVAELNYESERVRVEFRTDETCIYQGDTMDRTTAAVRGTAVVQISVRPTALTGAEIAMLCKLGFTRLYTDAIMQMDVDVHMNTQPDRNISIHTIVPLGEAY